MIDVGLEPAAALDSKIICETAPLASVCKTKDAAALPSRSAVLVCKLVTLELMLLTLVFKVVIDDAFAVTFVFVVVTELCKELTAVALAATPVLPLLTVDCKAVTSVCKVPISLVCVGIVFNALLTAVSSLACVIDVSTTLAAFIEVSGISYLTCTGFCAFVKVTVAGADSKPKALIADTSPL